ncbi:MAG: zeta toxin family protein [Bergeyella sp.]
MPDLYIITGSNGAGKSSVGLHYLPENVKYTIFDGDKLFMQKSREFWKKGIKSHKECKKLAIEIVEKTFENLMENAINNRSDFAYEGHFTNDATWDIPKKFKNHGYTLTLVFFGLTDTNLSQLRVIGRTKEGGHYVEPDTLAANFYGNLEKLDIYYPIFDTVKIFDTSTTEHIELAQIENGIPVFSEPELPEWFTSNLKDITEKIKGDKN